jgi:N-acetylglutamate synthase-like GNAT family acetyltransferase
LTVIMEHEQYYHAVRGDYLISTDRSLLDVDLIYHYLSGESYWAMDIPRNVVEKSIANSLCFGVYHHSKQIGFARLITDKATFAYLADVFITTDYRGHGLSKWLLKVIHAHPELPGLRRWMLGTRDAHSLYEQFGWTVLDEDTRKRFMQIHNRNAYK